MISDVEWKSLKGCEGYYEVSNDGRIKSVGRYINGKNGIKYYKEPKILKNYLNHGGYVYTGVNFNGKIINVRISRAVATAFIPNPDNKEQVDHIDGNKLNNCVSNLRWVSPKENIQYAIKNGLRPVTNENFMKYAVSGSDELNLALEKAAETHRKKTYCYSSTGELLDVYKSSAEAARQNNVSYSGVSACCKGILPTLKGKIYSYCPLNRGIVEA